MYHAETWSDWNSDFVIIADRKIDFISDFAKHFVLEPG